MFEKHRAFKRRRKGMVLILFAKEYLVAILMHI